MMTRIRIVGLALGIALGLQGPAVAKDYNKRPFLPPSGQAKVNNARAGMFATQAETERKSEEAKEQGICRDEETGVIVDRRNPRREVIIATQDIVNLGGRLELGADCR